MPEPEAGTVTTEQALLLLLLDKPADLKALEKAGAFAPLAPNRYWLKDLVQGYVKHMRQERDITTLETLAACFGVTSARVNQLVNDGWIKRVDGLRGRYNWREAVSGFVRFMRDEDRRSSKSASQTRVKDAQARDIEVRTQQRLGQLIPLEVYEEMIDNLSGMVRSEFAGLATATTRDLTMRRIIEREVNARLRRIAEAAMAQAIRAETAGGADDAVGTDGARPVGGGEQDLPANSSSAGAT